MSSHHIVREKQEPALLILSLTGFDTEHLGQLLEWSPTLIAAAPVADDLLAADIHIDYLLTDNADTPPAQPGLQIITAAPDDFLKAGLNFLIEKGYPAVNLITHEFEPQVYETYWESINLVIYCMQQKAYAVKSGFEKWLPAKTHLYIFNPPVDLNRKNLLLQSGNAWLVPDDGRIQLRFSASRLIIAEDI
ncbi:thiamine diphosphokinase [Mucilaginibacter koreensis]